MAMTNVMSIIYHSKIARTTIISIFLLICTYNSMAQEFGDSSSVNYMMGILEDVKDPSKQTGSLNPDSLNSLPIGIVKVIGQTRYIIAIDSARFLPDGAYFSAYMAIDLPGSKESIIF